MSDTECPGQGDQLDEQPVSPLVEEALPPQEVVSLGEAAQEDVEAAVAEELEQILSEGVLAEKDARAPAAEELEEILSDGVPAEDHHGAAQDAGTVEEIDDSDCDFTPELSLRAHDPSLAGFPGEPMVTPANQNPFRKSATEESSLGKGCSECLILDDEEDAPALATQNSAESVEQMMSKMCLMSADDPKPQAGLVVRACVCCSVLVRVRRVFASS